MSVNQDVSDPDWVPIREDHKQVLLDDQASDSIETNSDILYVIGIWRDNDKPFKLLYEANDGIRREIFCRPDWKFFNEDETMIVVYDTENEGNRTLYVNKILSCEKIPIKRVVEEGNYNTDLLLFIQNCQKNQTPFMLDYLKKDGTRRNIFCSEWNWLKKGTHISVYDIENEGRRTLIFENILGWIEEEFNELNIQEGTIEEAVEPDRIELNRQDAVSEGECDMNKENEEFNIIMDSLYRTVCDKWEEKGV